MLKLSARSMAFDEAGRPYVLVREGKILTITRLGGDDRLDCVRDVAKNTWWFRVLEGAAGQPTAFVRDDDGVGPVGQLRLGDARRARKVSAGDVKLFYGWHRVAATCDRPGTVYLVGASEEPRVYRLTAAGPVDLDGAPDKRSEAEQGARFYLAGREGIYLHRLGEDEPGKWNRLVEVAFRGCKQLATNAATDEIVAAGSYRGQGTLHFIDARGRVRAHDSPRGNGYWSVAVHDGRVFAYDFHSVVEVERPGKEKRLGVSGTIARNQCLFSGGGALWFVCDEGIHRLRGGRWDVVDVPGQTLVRAARPEPPRPRASAAAAGDDDKVAALRARVIAAPDDVETLRLLSDRLLDHGDLRGELIALQCVDEPSSAQKRRVAALLKDHRDEWLGRLAAVAARGTIVFERGYVRALGLKSAGVREVDDALLTAPEWATVERLDASMWPDERALHLLGNASLPNLRGVDGLHQVQSLASITLPLEQVSITSVRRHEVEAACTAGNQLTALRTATFDAQDMDTVLLEPLWRARWVQRLRELTVRPRQLAELAPRWLDTLTKLERLTILPGGMDRGGGWQLQLRRDSAGATTMHFSYHWPRAIPRRQYPALAALMRALPPFGATLVEVEPSPTGPPTPAQYEAMAKAAKALKRAT